VKPKVSMRRALADDDLLGKALKGDSWFAWRIVLIAVMGERLEPDEREVWRELTGGRDREPGVMAEETFIAVGRRSGKTQTAATAAVYLAALCDYSDRLAAGERAVLPLLSATQWQAARCLGFIRGIFTQAPALAGLIESETSDALRLRNGVDLETRPANFRNIRGASICAAVLDELAFWHVEGTRNPDTEIVAALRPALSTMRAPLLAISSPYAKRGVMWDAYRRHYGPDGDDRIVIVNAPSERMNPLIDKAVIARAYARDPQSAASEFCASFRSDVSNFIDYEIVAALVDVGVTVRPPRPSLGYRAAVDMSGGSHDSSVLAIGHDEGEIAVLDCVVEVKAPHNPVTAVETMADTLREYGLSGGKVIGDRYSPGWTVAAFAKVNLTYEYSEIDRSEAYLNVLPLFMSGKVKLIDNGRMISQFAALERRSLPSGRDKVDHGGAGGMDDVANAVSLVLGQRQSAYWADGMSWVSGPEDEVPPGPPLDPQPSIWQHPLFGGLPPWLMR
jgi:hypothetical protein